MEKLSDLKSLMDEQLRNMYDGRVRLSKALPKLHEQATDPRLKVLLEVYSENNYEETLHLKQVFNMLFQQKRGESCEAMIAMINESEDIVHRCTQEEVRDAGLITAIQHIIHYHLAGYGAICNYASLLGFYEIADLMHRGLEKEKELDRELIKLAEEVVNLKAVPVVHG